MEEHWNAGYPPSGASLDPTATYYQVAEVGAIRPPQAPHLDPEALVYFTALQPGAGVYPTAKRLLQPIPMQLATMLIPGTIWSMDGQLVNDGGNTYAERRTLTLGKRAPALRQLAQLFPLEQHRPLLLRETAPETWYAVIHGDNENNIDFRASNYYVPSATTAPVGSVRIFSRVCRWMCFVGPLPRRRQKMVLRRISA